MHTAHTVVHIKCSAQVTEKAETLDPIEHPLHKSTLPIPGVIAALPNTMKETQGSSQNAETKKHVTDERNGSKQTFGYRVQNYVYKVMQGSH